VQSDDGVPVSGIVVGASTFLRRLPGDNFGQPENTTVKQMTDKKGMAVLTLPSLTGEVACGPQPSDVVVYGPNFPRTGFYWTRGNRVRFTKSEMGKWQPWNPTVEIVLKRIINPIPMYAKKIEADIGSAAQTALKAGEPVSYDLEKGDWVVPHGNGQTADFIFKLNAKLSGKMTRDRYPMYDAMFTVTFANKGDGIRPVYVTPINGSVFRLPRNAPEDEYLANLVRQSSRDETGQHGDKPREDENYFFRVRTKKDGQGKIISALYGKIHGEIGWSYEGYVKFTYYLNPTPNDRNMEFDPKKNLFKKLSSLEQVCEP